MDFKIVNKDMLLKISNELMAKNITIACAESCTGGLLTAYFTSLSGSSSYLLGSIVSYTNSVKKSVLDVDSHSLKEAGAVSELVAMQMCENVRKIIKTHIGISITGVAGPSKSEDKPVGLVYIGLATKYKTTVDKYNFSGTRDEIREFACKYAFEMLANELKIK